MNFWFVCCVDEVNGVQIIEVLTEIEFYLFYFKVQRQQTLCFVLFASLGVEIGNQKIGDLRVEMGVFGFHFVIGFVVFVVCMTCLG